MSVPDLPFFALNPCSVLYKKHSCGLQNYLSESSCGGNMYLSAGANTVVKSFYERTGSGMGKLTLMLEWP